MIVFIWRACDKIDRLRPSLTKEKTGKEKNNGFLYQQLNVASNSTLAVLVKKKDLILIMSTSAINQVYASFHETNPLKFKQRKEMKASIFDDVLFVLLYPLRDEAFIKWSSNAQISQKKYQRVQRCILIVP